jgi:hypothetical protein
MTARGQHGAGVTLLPNANWTRQLVASWEARTFTT